MKNGIFENNGFGKAIKMILLGVSGDKAKIVLPQSMGGHIWESINKEIENETGRFMITTIKKNKEIVGKFVYNYDTDEELEYVYKYDFDSHTKEYILVKELGGV